MSSFPTVPYSFPGLDPEPPPIQNFDEVTIVRPQIVNGFDLGEGPGVELGNTPSVVNAVDFGVGVYGFGWTCARCFAVYAPGVTECWRCSLNPLFSLNNTAPISGAWLLDFDPRNRAQRRLQMKAERRRDKKRERRRRRREM